MFFGFSGPQGSKDQLKEVWEEADGLDPEDFDPKTFFNLHGKIFLPTSMNPGYENVKITCLILLFLCIADTNGDRFFDEQELEALFTKEVRSVIITVA